MFSQRHLSKNLAMCLAVVGGIGALVIALAAPVPATPFLLLGPGLLLAAAVMFRMPAWQFAASLKPGG